MKSGMMLLGVAVIFASLSSVADHRVDDEGFIRDWIVSGPWPNRQIKGQNMGLSTDHLNGERRCLPYPGKPEAATFVADWNILVAGIGSHNEWGFRTNTVFDATWCERHSDTQILRFNGTYKPIDDFFVVYAACYIVTKTQMDAVLLVGSDDDHCIWLDKREVGRTESSQDVIPASFRYPIRLGCGVNRLLFKLQDRTAGCGFCVQLLDKNEKPLKDVSIELDSRGRETTLEWCEKHENSPRRLRERLAAAAVEKQEGERLLAEERSRYAEISNRTAAVKLELKRVYAQLERDYALEHAANAAKGARSVDEPLPSVEVPRSSLCINGFWDSLSDGQTNWGKTYLPCRLPKQGMWAWFYPVQWGNCKPLPAFEDAHDPVHGAKSARFRTTFQWNGQGDVILRADAIQLVIADFLVNGVKIGSWNGDRGVARIPLANLAKGQNELEIRTRRPVVERWNNAGIRGDLFLETVGKIRAEDVWVKTSWRKSELWAETTMTNGTAHAITVEVRGYAVKDGRVRHRLPVKFVRIAANGSATVVSANGWADPETWGIGGIYGEPNLYTLVTDLVVDGSVVDRHVTEFGFREFWINTTDFFLNGKRIMLTGDVGHMSVNERRNREVMWPLYRKDGISVVRVHDSDQWSVTAVRDADHMGMAMYAQMYPYIAQPDERVAGTMYNENATVNYTNFPPFEAWQKTEGHRRNLAAYTRWWKDLRNHPSVLIWSTDNEIVTQAWHTEGRRAFNYRNDRIGTLYEKHMKALDPGLVMTRDGDVGTWSHREAWHEDPPCDTANYHYPDGSPRELAEGWQATYDYRPAIWGEAIYCAYFDGAAGKWMGARPDLVASRAKFVSRCAKLFTDLEVPCPVYMGLGLDGFFRVDESGTGNPWGIKASDIQAWQKAKGKKPDMPGRKPGEYPWLRIPWPAYSGEGERPVAAKLGCDTFGSSAFNVYDAGRPSHVRNAVNDAYRNALRPQPPVNAGRFAEVIVMTKPFAEVWTLSSGGTRIGVRADAQGRAWFCALEPGRRSFTANGLSVTADLSARGAKVANPGFADLQVVEIR